LELARRGAAVIAVEVDPRLVEVLRDRFRGEGLVSVVRSDALFMPVPRVRRVVGNVPYGISSRLLLKLLREPSYEVAVLTLQREFALRLMARPGTAQYGRISVITQLYADVEVVGSVSRRAFYPQPEVDSLVVRIRPRMENREFFEDVERLTAIIFSQRRRKLSKVMRRAGLRPAGLRGAVDLEKRVYRLTPGEVLSLAVALRGELRGGRC
ncbi:MAG: ribosomal RNA small subunit methyltransferase A, partial [Thermoprotei archaeon]